MTKCFAIISAALLASSISTSAVSQQPRSAGIGHSFFMRGTVVDARNSNVTICIGRADGAEVGQTLNVVRLSARPGPSKSPSPNFVRKDVGTVQIVEIFDDHFALATVKGGTAKKHDLVEFSR